MHAASQDHFARRALGGLLGESSACGELEIAAPHHLIAGRRVGADRKDLPVMRSGIGVLYRREPEASRPTADGTGSGFLQPRLEVPAALADNLRAATQDHLARRTLDGLGGESTVRGDRDDVAAQYLVARQRHARRRDDARTVGHVSGGGLERIGSCSQPP